MLRTILLVIALAIVVFMALVWTGRVPYFNRNDDGSVTVGTKEYNVTTTTTNVQVPVVKTETRQIETPAIVIENGANTQ